MSTDTVVNRGFDGMKNYKSMNSKLNTNFCMTNLIMDMVKGGNIKTLKERRINI